jgi:hypothetical protein
MKIPIRMLGIATTFFWIFLIAFFGSAAYSITDVRFDFGEPSTSANANNKIVFSLPVTIENKGFYDIGSFNVTTEILDKKGFVIARGFTSIPVIGKGENVSTTHNMTIDVNHLLRSDQNYLFNDTELKIREEVSMKIAEALPVQASANISTPWGAPLYNFTLGEPEQTAFNLTYSRVTVPISFDNHALFDIAGNIQMRMYNKSDLFVCDGQTPIEVSRYSSYNGYVEFYVKIAEMTDSGHFEVYFQTPFFNYGPLVIPYG